MQGLQIRPVPRYGWYILVRQVVGTRTARYQAVPPKIDRHRSIEGEKGKKKKRKRRKKRKEEYLFSHAILVGVPSRALFLPHEETEHLHERGERSR
ncbi:hypothetical protein B296_00013647 [Ensete ventricosum]|uniref:Uncharacterized protein n=1 Tax=Ensete ventricosum TaxID=4639 RepID=A0A427B8A5_ENSVE|nr:hypothetical protein B296_00013647 [Ensete ventricosum]